MIRHYVIMMFLITFNRLEAVNGVTSLFRAESFSFLIPVNLLYVKNHNGIEQNTPKYVFFISVSIAGLLSAFFHLYLFVQNICHGRYYTLVTIIF